MSAAFGGLIGLLVLVTIGIGWGIRWGRKP